ncbi:hypothetical protein SVAN01_04224 [Stagonosporopsis vannaccii]|nr:hypothetical protein SVAN01_04224 [Stagonosporopsis vannaccii]
MGRGGYDLTEPEEDRSSIGDAALFFDEMRKKEREKAAAEKAAEEEEKKLIKSKKSRGIMVGPFCIPLCARFP